MPGPRRRRRHRSGRRRRPRQDHGRRREELGVPPQHGRQARHARAVRRHDAVEFRDGRLVLVPRDVQVEAERTEENRNFLEDKIILNKELLEDKIILNKEDWMRAVDKDIEVNVERTKNAMRKDVQEKTAIIIERDERIDMLEKHLDKTCVERDCALATIAERDERIASLEKQLATTRALLYVSGPRNQQGPSPPSA